MSGRLGPSRPSGKFPHPNRLAGALNEADFAIQYQSIAKRWTRSGKRSRNASWIPSVSNKFRHPIAKLISARSRTGQGLAPNKAFYAPLASRERVRSNGPRPRAAPRARTAGLGLDAEQSRYTARCGWNRAIEAHRAAFTEQTRERARKFRRARSSRAWER
jgi:hypothetical protein